MAATRAAFTVALPSHSQREIQSQGKFRPQEAMRGHVEGMWEGVFVLRFDLGRQTQAFPGFQSTAASLGRPLSRLGAFTVGDREEGLPEPPL